MGVVLARAVETALHGREAIHGSCRVGEVEAFGRLKVLRRYLEHHVVLVQLGVDHRHFGLAEGVVERRYPKSWR